MNSFEQLKTEADPVFEYGLQQNVDNGINIIF